MDLILVCIYMITASISAWLYKRSTPLGKCTLWLAVVGLMIELVMANSYALRCIRVANMALIAATILADVVSRYERARQRKRYINNLPPPPDSTNTKDQPTFVNVDPAPGPTLETITI